MKRNCIECHSGPLFSELFDRADALELEPGNPIAFRLERTLLNSNDADAIALKINEARELMFRQAASLLIAFSWPTLSQAHALRTVRGAERTARRGWR